MPPPLYRNFRIIRRARASGDALAPFFSRIGVTTAVTRFPGEVYYLPPELRGDPKARPHILLSTCREDAETATLAYCSTQATEARLGAPYVLVDPFATRYNGTGLSEASYVHPSRLVAFSADQLHAMRYAGRLIDEMPDIRARTAESLGLDTGSCIGARQAAGSLRGRLLELKDHELFDTPYVLVVAQPQYSIEERFLNVIPLYDREEFDATAEDLIVEGAPFLETVGWRAAVIAMPLVSAVFYPDHVDRKLDCAFSDAEMDQVDTELRTRFGY